MDYEKWNADLEITRLFFNMLETVACCTVTNEVRKMLLRLIYYVEKAEAFYVK